MTDTTASVVQPQEQLRPRLPENDTIFKVKVPNRPGKLGQLLTVIGAEGASIGDIQTHHIGKNYTSRSITVIVHDQAHLASIEQAVKTHTDVEILEIKDVVFERHQGGKIHMTRRHEVRSLADLRYIYTPGVARVCKHIAANPASAQTYTAIGNTVGIFTNGTRVLGLGDIGGLASMPVMEGKAVLYDQFVGISAVPILIDTKDPQEFIETVLKIAPTFGGIHLEDIRTPDCFTIENELIARLHKPVMHDDQHGTATVLLAAIMSALRATGRDIADTTPVVAQLGLGAAGYAIAKLLKEYGFRVIGMDPNPMAQEHFKKIGGEISDLDTAMQTADIIVATTGVVGLIKPSMIRKGQIILSLSNPVPEIYPEVALEAGASFAADGKSVNNALAFPGLFKAALDVQANAITSAMKIEAAKAISALAERGELVPSPFHPDVHTNVVAAVKALF